MKKNIVCLVFLTAFCVGSVQARTVLSPIKAKGIVDRAQIGGAGLHVVSIWDARPIVSVAADGGFTTVISNQRPQKISLIDTDGSTRALAISLPDKPDNITFDATSTAAAVLFQDSGSFGKSADVERFLKLAEKKDSFKRLVLFLKSNLLNNSLEQLNRDERYVALVEECNNEIFGQDQKAIRSSLTVAQGRLKDLLE